MKKFLLLIALPVIFSSFTFMKTTGLTDAERKFAINHLKQTQADLLEAVQGLTDSQLNWKAAADRWSVLECVQHIVLASSALFQMGQGALKESNDTSMKSGVTDDQLIKMVEDRSRKVQTSEPLRPVNSPYHTLSETLKAFNDDRNRLVDYVQTTNDDLRGHIAKMPFGNIDCYQLVLMISAHTNRHMQQINEVKDDANFPED